MTPPIFDAPVKRQLEDLLRFQKLQAAAIRNNDIPTANRHFTRLVHATEQLAASPEGRVVLEQLLENRDAFVRLRAGRRVLDWQPEIAIPVLGRLTFEDLGEISADERIEIRTTASGLLRNYLGIRSFDRNDLIEPVRAYGVEIPFQDHAKWR